MAETQEAGNLRGDKVLRTDLKREFHSRRVNETHRQLPGRVLSRLNVAQIANHASL